MERSKVFFFHLEVRKLARVAWQMVGDGGGSSRGIPTSLEEGSLKPN